MGASKTRVLLVDDSAVLRRLAVVTLASLGVYEVDEAREAFQALELMRDRDYGVIVTDYYMPGIDGIEFVRQVRRMEKWSRTPVVMITTERDPYVEREARDAGVDAVIVKPFEPAQIKETLDRLLARDEQARALIDAQSLLDALPHPAMVLDRRHTVLLANEAFWRWTGSGVSDTALRCACAMHPDGEAPHACPLTAAIATGTAVEEVVETVFGRLVVAVYPMPIADGEGWPLYLHLTRPVPGSR